ncbi:MAG: PC4/YdbC family ssDNA-binding protein [Oscillospiraceae bacterium]|nr:PC4/YdbC family ssDNA-binding protein [Oscillospiraceae bacterium]
MAEFKFEVTEKIGVLSSSASGWNREINMVSWNDREPKLDIRDWAPDNTKMGKGISLSREEAKILKEILNDIEEL